MLVLDQFSSHKASDLLNQPTIELTFTIFFIYVVTFIDIIHKKYYINH